MKQTILGILSLLIAMGTPLYAATRLSTPTASKPNIVVFMVDDLGWNHISAGQTTMGTHDTVYNTPHIEKLANKGLSFTHAYMQPNCAPTRAALVSGQYPARVNNRVYVVQHLNRFSKKGLTKAKARFRGPEQSEDVAAAAITVAEALKQNGYATAHIGKYHVGGHKGEDTLPENVGFDINIGGFSQGHQPVCFASKKNGEWIFKGLGRGHFNRYAAPYTKAYLKKRALPTELVGTAKHVSDALGDAMEETIKTLSTGNKPFYLQFHTYAVHGPVKARPDLKQAAIARLRQDVKGRTAEYTGFIAGVDENMGRLLSILNDPDGDGDTTDSVASNTLVLFTSDNGGTHAPNTPLKGVKGELTEGGIRVPLIAYWPGVIPQNTITDHKVHAVDYYPTYLELAGNAWLPPEKEHPLDGESFADILRKPDTKRPRQPIFYLFPGYMDWRAQPCAVIIDDLEGKRYKLTYIYETNAWELYCLTNDQGETCNLIASRPAIAATLSKKLDAWLKQTHPTWQPKFPLDKENGKPVGPPPVFRGTDQNPLAVTSSKPNLIFVLSDDIAQGDLGVYGQKLIQTPNLDRLCREGTRYLSAYTGTSVCAPARSSFFTGLHMGNCPTRANREIKPEGQRPLPPHTVTIGKTLKQAGYKTACMGKWGMGMFHTSGSPLKNGIDHFFGYNCQRHAHSYFPPYLYDDDRRIEIPENAGGKKKVYAQELIQQDVLKWIDKNAGDPFFLFYAITLPHGRFEIDDQGLYQDTPWAEKEKNYAAMVTRIDSDMGDLVQLLKKKNIDKNTLIVFSGDNGSSFNPKTPIGKRFNQTMNGTLRGYKRGMYEGALRQAAFAWWPGTVPAGRVTDEPWAFWDLLPTFAELGRAALPAGFTPDGHSLVEFLKGQAAPKRDYFYWELHEGRNHIQAIRWDDWKAVRPKAGGPVELYNLTKDLGETTDLATGRPELVTKAVNMMNSARTPHPDWPDPAIASQSRKIN
jgi:arylsulfatase A